MKHSKTQTLLAFAYKKAGRPRKNIDFATAIDDFFKAKTGNDAIKASKNNHSYYNLDSFKGYLSRIKTQNEWVLIDENHEYGNSLAVYCGYESYNDFPEVLEDISDDEVQMLLDELFKAKRNPSTRKRSNDNPSSGLHQYVRFPQYFEDIELGKKGEYRINCITCSLFWAKKHIFSHPGKVLKNNNKYRYILTDMDAANSLSDFIEVVAKHPDLKQKFEFKALWLYKNANYNNPFKTGLIEFPIFHDWVFYEKRIDSESDDHRLEMSIVGVTPAEGINDEQNFSIAITDQRGEALFNWFKRVWGKIPTLALEEADDV